MSKFSRGASAWKEHRLADRFTAEGRDFTVQLIARRGTGVQGYRVTVHFIPHEGSGEVQAELPNAASTSDIHNIVRELQGDPPRVQQLFEQGERK
jgi:hypothetical protein